MSSVIPCEEQLVGNGYLWVMVTGGSWLLVGHDYWWVMVTGGSRVL